MKEEKPRGKRNCEARMVVKLEKPQRQKGYEGREAARANKSKERIIGEEREWKTN